jgi:hypothetical protein
VTKRSEGLLRLNNDFRESRWSLVVGWGQTSRMKDFQMTMGEGKKSYRRDTTYIRVIRVGMRRGERRVVYAGVHSAILARFTTHYIMRSTVAVMVKGMVPDAGMEP